MNKREYFLHCLGFKGYCEIPVHSKHPNFTFITRKGWELKLSLRRNIEKSIYTYSVFVSNPNGYYDAGLSGMNIRISESDYETLRDA